MMDRRQLLKIGGATLLVTGLGAGAFVGTRKPTKALAPWRPESHDFQDPRIRAMSYGLLAPNPHNRQPWMAELGTDNDITLYCDLDRRLPETDPYDRQITIGLGCFIELTRMAAAADGYSIEVKGFPDGQPASSGRLDQRPIAHLHFKEMQPVVDPLFAWVPKRRSNKEPYDTGRAIPDAAAREIVKAGFMQGLSIDHTLETDRVSMLRDLTWEGHKVESLTPRTLMESIDLMRIGKTEIEANPDGIDLGGAGIEIGQLVRVVSRADLATPGTTAFDQGMALYENLMKSAMGHVWIITPDNSRMSQLRAGAAWVRMNLQATALGIGMHPLSQALQEYPEMALLYEALHLRLDVQAPARIQMLGRIGYGPDVDPSPRWPIKAKIKNA